MSDQMNHFAIVMKQLRGLKKISLRDHAKELQITSSTLSRIENAKPCTIDTLCWVSAKTGISLDALLGMNHK